VGIPAVQICTITPIAKTVGAVRIVPGVAIPHPVGDPSLSNEKEDELRTSLLNEALEQLTSVPQA